MDVATEPVAGTCAYLQARKDALSVGTRVIVQSPDWMAGHTGVVIDMATGLLNGHDCCVELDPNTLAEPRGSLCFYWHELKVAPPTIRACPDCEQGKHRNCDGGTWDNDADDFTVCPCYQAGHGDPS
jgi:hypothetical protein